MCKSMACVMQMLLKSTQKKVVWTGLNVMCQSTGLTLGSLPQEDSHL